MANTGSFTWVPFYEEFAKKLLSYSDPDEDGERGELTKRLIPILKSVGQEHQNNNFTNIDPFTVFTFFNFTAGRQKEEDSFSIRQAVATAMKETFGITAPVPSDFDGSPCLLSNIRTFYNRSDEANSINNLWLLFKLALDYSDSKKRNKEQFSECFNKAIGISKSNKATGNRVKKLTIALFWISPEEFLSLDGPSQDFMRLSGSFPEKIVTALPGDEKIPASEYLAITEDVRSYLQSSDSEIKDFKNLSYRARVYSKQNTPRPSTQYWTYSIVDDIPTWEELSKDGIMSIGWDELGDLARFPTKEEVKQEWTRIYTPKNVEPKKNSLAAFEFVHDMKQNDIVYVRRGQQLVGRGIVDSDYQYDPTRKQGKSIRYVKWEKVGEWVAPDGIGNKRLTNITGSDFIEKLEKALETADPESKDARYYWVNQSKKSYEEEKRLGIIKAPSSATSRRSHWEILKDLKPGDKLLSYVDCKIKAELTVKSPFHTGKYERKGSKIEHYVVSVEYREIDPPISVNAIKKEVKWNDVQFLQNGPLVLQPQTGYCFLSNRKLHNLILSLENNGQNPPSVCGGENILLYGVPGSGKSWLIDNEYKDDSEVERIVFHPDYTYSDFVGQILPDVDEGKVTYKFAPGPFTTILQKAIKNPSKKFILVIEEINRGNAPAIFGDIFQLLDRSPGGRTYNNKLYPEGVSEYKIKNKNIAKEIYATEEEGIKRQGDENKDVFIPPNLTIIATMNTSDQNVFTLDTAFQRRWNMRLVENSFKYGKLAGTEILDTGVSWKDFCEVINAEIVKNKVEIVADKRLGVHFVHSGEIQPDGIAWEIWQDQEKLKGYFAEYERLLALEHDEELSDDEQREKLNTIRAELRKIRKFPEKVIKYLWDDAFKFNPDRLFKTEKSTTLESVINEFVFSASIERFKIFSGEIEAKLREKKQLRDKEKAREAGETA